MSTSRVQRYAVAAIAISVAAALFVRGGIALDAAYVVILALAFATTFRGARKCE